ncbi:hypothetical protein IC582_010794 [Cucumis melo]|uniref:NAD-dependent protein deacylase SRT2-like n=1 Tax=Cucumis melo TaxID=3656 RepID=A0ABM3KRS1_CUCME|nr:NAD-dependent protein deacylase SRT2-like [Cucumis melo]
MKQRPDGDIEIDEKYWEHDFCIPTCQKCNGVLKPDGKAFNNTRVKRSIKVPTISNKLADMMIIHRGNMAKSQSRLLRTQDN